MCSILCQRLHLFNKMIYQGAASGACLRKKNIMNSIRNCFYMFIKNTLCCSFKITSITEVADSIKFVVFMLLKKSLMFCFIITLAAGITLSFKGRLEGMCVLIWLKLLYNQIVFMGNKIIHESPYKYFKIFFLCCFIVTMTACEISPHMDRFCFMITLYAWVTNSFRDRLNKLLQITLSCCFMITFVAWLTNSFMYRMFSSPSCIECTCFLTQFLLMVF